MRSTPRIDIQILYVLVIPYVVTGFVKELQTCQELFTNFGIMISKLINGTAQTVYLLDGSGIEYRWDK
jgi:hypothetical protein